MLAVAKRTIPVAHTVESIANLLLELFASLCGNLCQLIEIVHSNNAFANQSNIKPNEYPNKIPRMSFSLFI